MSTILKALRRLEEDSGGRTTQTERPTATLPATDSRAADELRDRILAEEFAAQAAAAAHGESNRKKRIVMVAAASLLVLGLGVGAYTTSKTSTRAGSDPKANVFAEALLLDSAPEVEDPPTGKTRVGVGAAGGVDSSRAPSERALASPTSETAALFNAATTQRHSPPDALAGNQAIAIPTEETRPESEVGSRTGTASRSAATKSVAPSTPPSTRGAEAKTLAALTRTPADIATRSQPTIETPDPSLAKTLAPAPAETRAPRDRPEPKRAAPNPLPNVAALEPRPVQDTQPAESRPRRESQPPREFQPSPEPGQVEHLDRRGLPDLTVLRTAWHPDADRRSARIRLEASDEILTLREGDAIGGLVIQKISPSAVLFKFGEVEIQRRVGRPGSGG